MKSQLGKRTVLKESEDAESYDFFNNVKTLPVGDFDFSTVDLAGEYKKAAVIFLCGEQAATSVGILSLDASGMFSVYIDDDIYLDDLSESDESDIVNKIRSVVDVVYLVPQNEQGEETFHKPKNPLFVSAFGKLPFVDLDGNPIDKSQLTESRKPKNKVGLSESFIKSASLGKRKVLKEGTRIKYRDFLDILADEIVHVVYDYLNDETEIGDEFESAGGIKSILNSFVNSKPLELDGNELISYDKVYDLVSTAIDNKTDEYDCEDASWYPEDMDELIKKVNKLIPESKKPKNKVGLSESFIKSASRFI